MKLKLSNRERVLLTITVICMVAALFYYAVVIPQLATLSKLEKQAAEYSQRMDQVKAKASLENHVYQDYKNINSKTEGILRNYYPSIIQEKLVLMLEENIKKTNIELLAISFSEPAPSDINKLETEKPTEVNELEDLVQQLYNEKKPALQEQATQNTNKDILNVEKMTASLSFKGSYGQIYSFLKEIELQNRSIICNEINITSKNAELTCDLKLDFYAVPKPIMQDDEYLNWELTGEYGKSSPF